MRLVELSLISFGHFERRVLSFSSDPGIVKIIYGRNEAGKSTSLRAVEALLFGFESKSRDAQGGKPNQRRVAGTLQKSDGTRLSFMRRNARKQSLRNLDDEALPDDTLQGWLGGVDRELFRALYGLDPERLRAGAESLLEAKGGVGESLFEAGLAGAGASRLARRLHDEADLLWVPKATARPLAEAARGYLLEMDRVRQSATPVRAFDEQLAGIAAAKAKHAEAIADLQKLEADRRHISRAVRAIPHLGRRRQLQLAREALGSVVLLPLTAGEQRESAEVRIREVAIQAETLSLATLQLDSQLAELPEPEARLDIHAALELLAGRLRAYQNIEEEAPERQSEVDQLRAILAAETTTPLSKVAEASLREALRESAALARSLVEIINTEQRLHERKRELDALAVVVDRAKTQQHVAQLREAERELPRDAELQEKRLVLLQQRQQVQQQRDDLAGLLGIRDCEALPALETAESEYQRLADLYAGQTAKLGRIFESQQSTEQRQRLLLEQRAQGEHAELTIAALEALRLTRDRLILQPAESAVVMASVREADLLADRLRDLAGRIATQKQLDSELARQATELLRLREASAAEQRTQSEIAQLAQQLRTPHAPPQLDPPQLLLFAQRYRELVRLTHEATALREREQLVISIETRRRMHLSQLLAVPKEGGTKPEPCLHDLERTLQDRIAVNEEQLSVAQRHEQELSSVVVQLNALAEKHEDLERLLREQEARKQPLLLALGAESGASEPQIQERLAKVEETREIRARLDELEKNTRAAERVREQLAAPCRRMQRDLECDLQHLPLAEQAERLLNLLRRLRADESKRSELSSQREQAGRELARAQSALARAQHELNVLVERAGVPLEQLAEAETRSERAHEIDSELAKVELALAAVSDGMSLPELVAEYENLSEDAAEARLDEIEQLRDSLERERDSAHRSAIAREQAVPDFEDSKAAEHALLAEQHFSEAQPLALRYVTLKIGAAVLEREMEAYRKTHQAPVLKRASELFERLTAGRYERIGVELSERDRPELVCIQPDGEQLEVSLLSDGARDQLFLALRLATVLRQAEHGEPMFLVLDDALVHFDDARTRLALGVLGDVAKQLDVLIFSHHESLISQAEAELGSRASIIRL